MKKRVLSNLGATALAVILTVGMNSHATAGPDVPNALGDMILSPVDGVQTGAKWGNSTATAVSSEIDGPVGEVVGGVLGLVAFVPGFAVSTVVSAGGEGPADLIGAGDNRNPTNDAELF